MLYLRTGLPGSGKTLNTIREIELEHGPLKPPGFFRSLLIKLGLSKPFVQRSPRTVYYYGIPDLDTTKLTANWVEFQTPDKWYEQPDGSVIVIDEAQRIFGAQDGRKARPEHVARFETHRHQGLDIHLITQHPSLLMTHVRKLVGKHINMYRAYGGKRLLRHEYEFCIDAPEKRANFKQAQERRVSLDPKYYGLYRSATVHTHKFKLPNYVYLIPILLFFIVGSGFVVSSIFVTDQPEKPEGTPISTPDNGTDPQISTLEPTSTAQLPGQAQMPSAGEQILTPEQYADSFTPRIPDIPMSAPRYDKLTEPKSFPRLSCVMSVDPDFVTSAKNRRLTTTVHNGVDTFCQCYTQQTTRYDTSFEFCRSTVENGYFDDTRPDSMASTPGVFNPARQDPSATGRGLAAQLPTGTTAPTSTSNGDYIKVIADNSNR